MSTTNDDKPPPHETEVDRPRSADALTLLLYAPVPGYALVCFDRHPTHTVPSSMQQVANRLGDPRSPTEMSFILCWERDVGAKALREKFNIELKEAACPIYVLFKCGGDFQELDRLTDASRDKCHKDRLRSFCIDGQDKNSDPTLQEKLLHQKTKFKVSHLLRHWVKAKRRQRDAQDEKKEKDNKKDNETMDEPTGGRRLGKKGDDENKEENKDKKENKETETKKGNNDKSDDETLPTEDDVKLNENSKCYPKLGPHEIVVVAGRSGACQLLAYIGKETPRFDNNKEDNKEEKKDEKKEDDNEENNNQHDKKRNKDVENPFVPGLMEACMHWNNTAHDKGSALHGFLLGIERKSGRFTLEGTVQIVEERWNPVTFGQYIELFRVALDETLAKIRTFKEEAEKKRAKATTSSAPTDQRLRDKRLTKFLPVAEENSDDDSSNGSEEEDFDSLHCMCCRKDFISEGQYKVHLLSKKHKKSRKRYEEQHANDDADVEAVEQEMEPTPETSGTRKRKHPQFRGSPERIEFLRQRERLRGLVAKDKQERRENGGVLPSRLGAGGFHPVGTHHPEEEEDNDGVEQGR